MTRIENKATWFVKPNRLYCVVILPLLFILGGCQTSPSMYTANLAKQKAFTPDLQTQFLQQNQLTAPFAAYFQKEDAKVLYIGGYHGHHVNSPTHLLFEEAILGFTPDLVILEGFETTLGLNPDRILKLVKEQCNVKTRCSDPLFQAYHTLAIGREFIGAEPEDKSIFLAINSTQDSHSHYTQKDLDYFFFAQQVPQYKRANPKLDNFDLKKLFYRYKREFKVKEPYTFSDFQSWLYAHYPSYSDLSVLFNVKLTSPNPKGHYLQQLASRVGLVRDAHALKLILSSLSEHKKVLVYFGFSHYPPQREVLEHSLGKPKYTNTLHGLQRILSN